MNRREASPEPRTRLRARLPRLLALVAVGLLLALLGYGLATTGRSDRIDESLSRGETAVAPEFELPLLKPGSLPPTLAARLDAPFADERLSLSELRGTPFVLNFWASWCDPCREEAPVLADGWQRHGRRGVLYLGLNMQDLTSDARDFLRDFEVTYPTIREQSHEVATSYGATGLPETYFVSGQGRVVGHVVGVVSDEQLDRGVAAARSGRVTGTLSGGARREQR